MQWVDPGNISWYAASVIALCFVGAEVLAGRRELSAALDRLEQQPGSWFRW